MLASAKGIAITPGRGITARVDAPAGLWCASAMATGRQEIVEAISRQAGIMDYAPGLPARPSAVFEAATAVASFMPQGLDRVLHQTRVPNRSYRP